MFIVAGIAIIALLLLGFRMAIRLRPLAMLALGERSALRRAGMRRAGIESTSGRLRYFRGGSGPVMMMLHGAGDQAGAWSRAVPKLMSGYDLIIPDLPGHGDSGPANGPLAIGTILEGIQSLLEKTSPRDPVILVGNSLGAWIATLIAQRHPERVARLVLVNGGPLIGDRPDLSLMPKNREQARSSLDATRCPDSKKVPDYVLDDIIRLSNRGPISRMAGAAASALPFLLEGRLGEIRVPVDLLWGQCDQLMSASYAERMLAGLPGARLTLLPKGGHVPQRECPGEFAARLLEILQTHAQERKANL